MSHDITTHTNWTVLKKCKTCSDSGSSIFTINDRCVDQEKQDYARNLAFIFLKFSASNLSLANHVIIKDLDITSWLNGTLNVTDNCFMASSLL